MWTLIASTIPYLHMYIAIQCLDPTMVCGVPACSRLLAAQCSAHMCASQVSCSLIVSITCMWCLYVCLLLCGVQVVLPLLLSGVLPLLSLELVGGGKYKEKVVENCYRRQQKEPEKHWSSDVERVAVAVLEGSLGYEELYEAWVAAGLTVHTCQVRSVPAFCICLAAQRMSNMSSVYRARSARKGCMVQRTSASQFSLFGYMQLVT